MVYQFKLTSRRFFFLMYPQTLMLFAAAANSAPPDQPASVGGTNINAIALSMAKKRAAAEDEHQNISPKKRKLNPVTEPEPKSNSILSRDDSLENVLLNDDCLNWSECDEVTKVKLEKIEEQFIQQLQRKEKRFMSALRKKEEDLLKRLRVKEEEIELREKAVEVKKKKRTLINVVFRCLAYCVGARKSGIRRGNWKYCVLVS